MLRIHWCMHSRPESLYRRESEIESRWIKLFLKRNFRLDYAWAHTVWATNPMASIQTIFSGKMNLSHFNGVVVATAAENIVFDRICSYRFDLWRRFYPYLLPFHSRQNVCFVTARSGCAWISMNEIACRVMCHSQAHKFNSNLRKRNKKNFLHKKPE